MNVQTTRWSHVAIAVGAAAAFTFVVICLMLILNYHVAVAAPQSCGFRHMFIDGQRNDRSEPSRKQEEMPDPQQDDEIMTVDLDASLPTMPAIEPLNLNVAIPSPDVNAVRISVRDVRSVGKNSSPPSAAAISRSTSDEPRAANQVDQPPREPVGNAKPPYPQRERELGIEGTVVVELLIDERGRVVDLKFASGAEAFRKAVADVARTWRFEPARDGGQAIKVWGTKEVRFTHPRNRS